MENWNMSPEIGELVKALAEFQAEIQTLKKTADNPFFKSKYLPLPDLLRGIQPHLSGYGLAIVQPFQPTMGKDGTVDIVTILMHASGQWIRGVLSMPVEKRDPQKMGSAITYGCRYSLCAMLGVAGAADDDAEKAMETHRTDDTEQPTELSAWLLLVGQAKTKKEVGDLLRSANKAEDMKRVSRKWKEYLKEEALKKADTLEE